MSPNDLATHNKAAKFKICLLIQITVKRCQVRLLNIKIWEMYKKSAELRENIDCSPEHVHDCP
jgi:hypothetical protein